MYTHICCTPYHSMSFTESFYYKEPIDLKPGTMGYLEAYDTGPCVVY